MFFKEGKKEEIDYSLVVNGAPELTLRKICHAMDVKVPRRFKKIQDEINNNIEVFLKRVTQGTIYMLMYDRVNVKDHLDRAMEKGAKVIFMEKESFKKSGLKKRKYPVILLENKLEQVGKVFSDVRTSYPAKTIAITGTVGKTTTNRFLGELVKKSAQTFNSRGNLNSYSAVAKHILTKMTEELEVYIQEVGAGDVDSVRKAASMLKPDAFILLDVSAHHMNTYGTYEKLFNDKISFDDYLSEDGVIVANFDNENIATHEFKHKVISFGIKTDRPVDYRAINIVQNREKLEFDIVHNGKTIPVQIEILGKHNVYNALAAFAMASWLGIGNKRLVNRFKNYQSTGIRSNLRNIGGRYLYVDCYNACEASILSTMKGAEEFNVAEGNRKIAILGGENKLGELAQDVHYRIGAELKGAEVDEIVFFGTEKTSRAAIDRYGDAYSMQRGYTDGTSNHATVLTDLDALTAYLKSNVNEGDFVLFKGVLWLDIAIAIDKAFGTSFTYEYEYYIERSTPLNGKPWEAHVLSEFGEAEILGAEPFADGILHIPEKIGGGGYPLIA